MILTPAAAAAGWLSLPRQPVRFLSFLSLFFNFFFF